MNNAGDFLNVTLKSERHSERFAIIPRFIVDVQERTDLDRQRVGKVQWL